VRNRSNRSSAAIARSSTASGEATYDLREAYSWGNLRWVRRYLDGWKWLPVALGLSIGILGLAHVVLSAILLPPPLWTPANAFDVVVAPVGLFVGYWSSTWFRDRVAWELKVTKTEFRVKYLDSRVRILSWDDPSFRAALVTRSGDPVLGGHTLYGLSVETWPEPVILDAAAFAALRREAEARGLVRKKFSQESDGMHREVVELGPSGASPEALQPS
jgi:hypothetical protein